MATLLGIKQGFYSEIESAKFSLSQEHLTILATQTELNLGWLFTGNGPMLKKEGEDIWTNVFLPMSAPPGVEVDKEKVAAMVRAVLAYSRLPLVTSDFAYNLLEAICERSVLDNPRIDPQGEAIPVIGASLLTLVDLFQTALRSVLAKEQTVTVRFRGGVYVFAQ